MAIVGVPHGPCALNHRFDAGLGGGVGGRRAGERLRGGRAPRPAAVAFYTSISAAEQAAAALGEAPPVPVVTAGRVDVVYLAPPSEPTRRQRQGIERCALGTASRTTYHREQSDGKPAPPGAFTSAAGRAGGP